MWNNFRNLNNKHIEMLFFSMRTTILICFHFHLCKFQTSTIKLLENILTILEINFFTSVSFSFCAFQFHRPFPTQRGPLLSSTQCLPGSHSTTLHPKFKKIVFYLFLIKSNNRIHYFMYSLFFCIPYVFLIPLFVFLIF